MLADLMIHRLGVAFDRVFACAIGGHVGRGHKSEYGRQIDDPSASLGAHVRQYGLGHADNAKDVDVEQILGLGDRILLGGSPQAHTGIVDQDIDAPELPDHPLD